MSHIEVNVLYLQNLAHRTRGIEDALRQFSDLADHALDSSPKVQRAYQDFGRKWDMRRNELADALSVVADGFDTTWRAFDETDKNLADTVTGE